MGWSAAAGVAPSKKVFNGRSGLEEIAGFWDLAINILSTFERTSFVSCTLGLALGTALARASVDGGSICLHL